MGASDPGPISRHQLVLLEWSAIELNLHLFGRGLPTIRNQHEGTFPILDHGGRQGGAQLLADPVLFPILLNGQHPALRLFGLEQSNGSHQ